MKLKTMSKNVKGIIRVSAANMTALAISLITSFVLPYFISVKDYGYWQLYVMYAGYAGFFAFGFNDGVHLNYASAAYTEENKSKFHTFSRLLLALTTIETIILLLVLFLFGNALDDKRLLFIFVILSIIPNVTCGLFTYMNQCMMRFKEYALGNIIDNLFFICFMAIMIVIGIRNGIIYIAVYTITRYIVILYHFISSRDVFTAKPVPVKLLKQEIIHNFTSGFMLMIATLLNGSIIVGSRLIVENRFGIEEFSAYSFSIHTLVIASQLISSISAVFYPVMKRCERNKLYNEYDSFDKVSALLSSVLLLSYYPAALCVLLLYKKYASIISYLYFVYPLFIFQCKSNLLIINTYKVIGQPIGLIKRNIIGIALNVIGALIAYIVFGTVASVAISVLITYMIWYYFSQFVLFKKLEWKPKYTMLIDCVVTMIFIFSNLISTKIVENLYHQMLCGCCMYTVLIAFLILIRRRSTKKTITQTLAFLND